MRNNKDEWGRGVLLNSDVRVIMCCHSWYKQNVKLRTGWPWRTIRNTCRGHLALCSVMNELLEKVFPFIYTVSADKSFLRTESSNFFPLARLFSFPFAPWLFCYFDFFIWIFWEINSIPIGERGGRWMASHLFFLFLFLWLRSNNELIMDEKQRKVITMQTWIPT